MTEREKKIKGLANGYANSAVNDIRQNLYEAFKTGAKWADNNLNLVQVKWVNSSTKQGHSIIMEKEKGLLLYNQQLKGQTTVASAAVYGMRIEDDGELVPADMVAEWFNDRRGE